jgi:hypothetical protein
MKTRNHFSQEYRLLIKVLSLLLFFIIGCTKQELMQDSFNGNLNEKDLKCLPINEGPIILVGFSRFDIYAIKEHRVITDGREWYLLCTAELIFPDKRNKQNFVLNTTESFDNGDGTQTVFRKISFKGKMTPGGLLTFCWPKTWLELDDSGNLTDHSNVIDQMRDHQGYDLHGQGVNQNTLIYTGYFIKNKFQAAFHIIGFYREPGSMGAPYDVVVDGPISVSFSFDLQVSD